MKTILLWLLTIIITLASVAYQRMTGPTYPIRNSVNIKEQKISYRLLRTHETTGDAEMEIYAPDDNITGEICWRRFKSYDKWTIEPLERRGDNLLISIPRQPAAGKVIYDVTLIDSEGSHYKLSEEPVVIRFKGAVPLFILFPHVLFMFTGMLLATRTGLEGIFKRNNLYRLTLLTLGLLFVGGLILGPIVQKYAFGALWTGWPFGHDLTDNKTLVAVIFWAIAMWRMKVNKGGRAWAIAAAIVTLAIYLIPHSTLGSEIDYTRTDNIQ